MKALSSISVGGNLAVPLIWAQFWGNPSIRFSRSSLWSSGHRSQGIHSRGTTATLNPAEDATNNILFTEDHKQNFGPTT